jgi:hypothetical protein
MRTRNSSIEKRKMKEEYRNIFQEMDQAHGIKKQVNEKKDADERYGNMDYGMNAAHESKKLIDRKKR